MRFLQMVRAVGAIGAVAIFVGGCTQPVGDGETVGATTSALGCLICDDGASTVSSSGSNPAGAGNGSLAPPDGASGGGSGTKDDIEEVTVTGPKRTTPKHGDANPRDTDKGDGVATGTSKGEKTCLAGGDKICLDNSAVLKACIAAAQNDAEFKAFVNWVSEFSKVAAARLWYAGLKDPAFRERVCWAVFGD